MKFEIRRSFEKDAEKLTVTHRQRVALIFDEVSNAKRISELESCKKLTGHNHAYRIRLGSLSGYCIEKIYTSIFPDI